MSTAGGPRRDRPAHLIVALADRLSAGCGRLAAGATLACTALLFAQVAARYGLGRSSIALQEAVQWLFAGGFLFGLAWALAEDRHVRVDLWRQGLSPRRQAALELAGVLALLLPFCLFALWISVDYVAASWRAREASPEPGGLPALYLLKAVFPASMALLALQGLAQALRAFDRLRERAGR